VGGMVGDSKEKIGGGGEERGDWGIGDWGLMIFDFGFWILDFLRVACLREGERWGGGGAYGVG
jgi:hypothetical protein